MKSCLIVEDSTVIRMVARKILQGLHFDTSEAADGREALDACKAQLPDAVLLAGVSRRKSHLLWSPR